LEEKGKKNVERGGKLKWHQKEREEKGKRQRLFGKKRRDWGREKLLLEGVAKPTDFISWVGGGSEKKT